MKKVISLLLVSIISIGLFATKHNHTDEYEVRYVKVKSELNKQYQEQLRNTQLWQNFNYNNPGWFVIFNEENQLPHRAFGEPIYTNDLISFLTTNNFSLPNDLRLKSEIKNDKYTNKSYVQYYNNLEVIGSNLYAKFSQNNELIAFGLDVYNDINLSIIPTISEQNIISFATTNITNNITNVVVSDDLKVLAIPTYRKYDYRLIYEIKFSTKIEEGPANYTCYVDAHTGELLMRKNSVMYEVPPSGTSTVSGEVYPTNPYDPAIVQNFKYLKAISTIASFPFFSSITAPS